MLDSSVECFSLKKEEILQEAFEISQDYSSEFFHSQTLQVGKRVLIIGENASAHQMFEMLQAHQYQTTIVSAQHILSVSGHLGGFEIVSSDGDFQVDQIILFCDDENLKRFRGCESADKYRNAEELLEAVEARVGNFKYHQIIHYDHKHCQYHHRRARKDDEECCHRCVDVCPTWGVGKDSSLVELRFSSIDCIDCGKCVMVCPSGAVQRDGYTLASIAKIAKLYRGISPVISSQTIEGIDFGNTLLLKVAQVNALNEVYLLTLIQESGSEIVVFDPQCNAELLESITFINQIFQIIYHKEAIYLARTLEELQDSINLVTTQEAFFYPYAQDESQSLRQIFAERLRFLVKNEDYGKVCHQSHFYGGVKINEHRCTMCHSCIGACNVGSLTSANLKLSHNQSLCTTCGYCIASCPEDAISLDRSGVDLRPQWFEYQTMAQDQGFQCIECGKVFATSKAVQKIKEVMTPIFANDEVKLKTLECCENCKAKLMLGLS